MLLFEIILMLTLPMNVTCAANKLAAPAPPRFPASSEPPSSAVSTDA